MSGVEEFGSSVQPPIHICRSRNIGWSVDENVGADISFLPSRYQVIRESVQSAP
jgi:hypothetical protein